MSDEDSAITIRSLSSHVEYAACVDLQRETWGRHFTDAVPASILLVAQKVGGVAAGAFATDGRLLGFVFGITGLENGTIVHWSDMLAVRPEAQNLGLARRLKEFQRAAVARAGAHVIYWTYDPLVARNAHLNFNVFGVSAVKYARDMYGETGSDLHRGIGTDRLIVAWAVRDAELSQRKLETAAARDARAFDTVPIIGDAERAEGRRHECVGSSDRLRLAVPTDITAIQAADAPGAAKWRASTRPAFEAAFANDYQISGFKLDPAQDRGFYLLARHQS